MIGKAAIRAGGAPLLALALAAPLHAQRVDPTRIIEMHVNAERQNVSFDGAVVEGGKFRLTFPGGARYAISPVQTDAAGSSFFITVFRLTGEKESEAAEVVETVRASRGTPVPLRSLPYVTVVIERVRRTAAQGMDAPGGFTFASSPRRPALGFAASADGCCVECGGVIVCGCAVSSKCGRCCVNPCCEKMPAEPPLGARWTGPESFEQLASGRACKSVPDHERLFTRREDDGTITLLATR